MKNGYLKMKKRHVNGILNGICIRKNVSMLQLKEEICVTLYLDRDINIRMKCKGVYITLTIVDARDIEYFMKINVG